VSITASRSESALVSIACRYCSTRPGVKIRENRRRMAWWRSPSRLRSQRPNIAHIASGEEATSRIGGPNRGSFSIAAAMA